jgi:alanyl-tRNA synthetase
MEEHREASGKGVVGEIDVDALSIYSHLLENLQAEGKLPAGGVLHRYAEFVELESPIVAILRADGEEGLKPVKHAREGDHVEVVLAETPFYVESGGQIFDTGLIVAYESEKVFAEDGAEESIPMWILSVEQTRRPVPGMIVHAGQVESGTLRVGEQAWAIVDYDRRMDIARNHTATHILHAELRYVLGEHVQQAGSLVAPDRLRFDFSCGAMLTQDQLNEIEHLVNAAILADYPVDVSVEPYHQAVAEGAMALFGEKYGDRVRVIKIGYEEDEFSKELCGGTHVTSTSQIGLFRILSESSVAAGIRRIEAVTGSAAMELAQERLNALDEAALYLGCRPEEVGRKVLSALDDQLKLRKEVEHLSRQMAMIGFEQVLKDIQKVRGVPVLAAQVQAGSVELLREMCDWFRDRIGSGVVVLGTVLDNKPLLVSAVTPDLAQRGLHAGTLIQRVARVIGGGGGGKPTMAQAGGHNPDRLPEALALVSDLVRESLSS